MNKKNLEILGLSDGATEEEIKAAYESLRAKYLEERFMDGEKGNNAAKMLTKIETAYNSLMTELSESAASDGGGASYTRVEELIKAGDLQEAQRVLDSFDERTAQWHFLQSLVFYRKNWVNESKKQLEIAIQLDPENAKYKETYRRLSEKAENQNTNAGAGSAYQGQTMAETPDDQMGGNFCSWCIQCCYINMCINCLCNCCR